MAKEEGVVRGMAQRTTLVVEDNVRGIAQHTTNVDDVRGCWEPP